MTGTSKSITHDTGLEAHLSAAHKASQQFVIDPAYDAYRLNPSPNEEPEKTPWIYGNAQWEAWVVEQIVNSGFAASRHVHYERNYGRVASVVSFRCGWPDSVPQPLTLHANGKITVRTGLTFIFEGTMSQEPRTIPLPENTADPLIIDVEPGNGEPAALLIEHGFFQTGATWQSSTDGKSWVTASIHPQTKSGRMPHACMEPVMLLQPVSMKDGVCDFGINILARPVFICDGTPTITAGESPAEANASAEYSESNTELVPLPDGRWTSRHPLGFRYLRITGGTPAGVAAEASYHPAQYRGAFACSDERLTRIWMHSAYTLRLCMQQLMLDGVKRDRMPWVGDQASNLIVNAYTFADAEIIRHSLTALGRPTGSYINGIVDYSLWWVINMERYQRYFADPGYLEKELPHIDALLAGMAKQCDQDGFLRPGPEAWVFIDWGVKQEAGKTLTALQIMWYWAQRTGMRLAERAGDRAMASRWRNASDALAVQLRSRTWNPDTGAWQEYMETPGTNSPYPNFLAVLSGLARVDDYEGIRRNLVEYPATGTPFMNGFALMALARVGETGLATQRIRDYWGGMLDRGATTFWEDFKTGEEDNYAMYGRPFGKSLCHAWSSGPAAILSAEILGIRPLQDGWKEFAVIPHLGDLTWASAAVPTPAGNIEMEADRCKTTVNIPPGLTLLMNGERHPGPATIEANATMP